MRNYQNFLVKDLKDQFIGMNIRQKVMIKLQRTNLNLDLEDQFIGMNIRQKVIIKMQQTNLDFFSNKVLVE